MEEFTPCAVCARTPLIGEAITVAIRDRREATICDLCLQKPRAATLGEPSRRDRVRSAAGAANVHRVFPRPVVPDGAQVAEPAAAGFLR